MSGCSSCSSFGGCARCYGTGRNTRLNTPGDTCQTCGGTGRCPVCGYGGAKSQTLQGRIWTALLFATLLGIHSSAAIWNHQLIGSSRSLKLSPVVGVVIGSIEMVIGLCMLVAWVWGGYRDMKAARKENGLQRE